MRTCWWISPLSETGSSSCARASSLIPLPMARSSGGRLPGRPAGRALHQPEECATSLFPHDGGHDLQRFVGSFHLSRLSSREGTSPKHPVSWRARRGGHAHMLEVPSLGWRRLLVPLRSLSRVGPRRGASRLVFPIPPRAFAPQA